MNYTISFLSTLTNFARVGGLFVIVLIAIGVLVSSGARDKLSLGRTAMILAGAVFAGVAIWVLPSLINYARYDVGTIVPEYPIGGYGQ
ncbi:hypothetical protein [Nocardia sp. NPDC049149]|uniref:hypothetical protein n=1 Tax=Nocardia sp. NPDC049149 TaxID=3364315 RepID=UPI0037179891